MREILSSQAEFVESCLAIVPNKRLVFHCTEVEVYISLSLGVESRGNNIMDIFPPGNWCNMYILHQPNVWFTSGTLVYCKLVRGSELSF